MMCGLRNLSCSHLANQLHDTQLQLEQTVSLGTVNRIRIAGIAVTVLIIGRWQGTVGDLKESLNRFFVKHSRFHPRLSNDRVHATVLSTLWAYHSLPFTIPGWFVL